MRDWQVRCVCGGHPQSCNNGWMREIEGRAKPILTKLIKGDAVRIHPQDQEAIATWAALKSMVSEFYFEGKGITHHMQRRRMMKRRLPPQSGWGIWIGCFERKLSKLEWASHPMLLLADDEALRRAGPNATRYNSNATTQIIGKLFIQIIHGPRGSIIDRWRFSLPNRGTLYRIWPVSGYTIVWPGQALSEQDGEAARDAFPRFLLQKMLSQGNMPMWPGTLS